MTPAQVVIRKQDEGFAVSIKLGEKAGSIAVPRYAEVGSALIRWAWREQMAREALEAGLYRRSNWKVLG